MSRTLSTAINNQITPDTNTGEVNLRLAHLLKISTATPIYVTNHQKNISFDDGDGSQTYIAGGSFVSLAEVTEKGSLEYQNIAVSLQNITTTVRDTFKDLDFVNADAKIFVAFLDTDETIIDAYEYFTGSVSYASLAEQKGQFGLNIELANQWRNWNIIKGRKFTGASQQLVFSGDKGMDFAHETNSDVRWNR